MTRHDFRIAAIGLAPALLLTATTALAQLTGTENGEWRYLGATRAIPGRRR